MLLDKNKLQEYFYGNVASVFWSFFLISGAVVFFLYYIHIGYMPDFDMTSSVSLLAAVSATSILFLVSMVVMGIMPGLFWDYYWKDIEGDFDLSDRWTGLEAGATVKSLFFWFALPILFVFISTIGVLFFGLYSLVLLPLVSFIYFLYILKEYNCRYKVGFKKLISLVFAIFMSSIFAFFPLYFIMKALSLKSEDVDKVLYLSGLLSLFVVFMNILVAAPITAPSLSVNIIDKKKFKKNLAIGFSVLVMISLGSNSAYLIPEAVMRLYKFGNIDASRIVFDKDGCSILTEVGLVADGEYDMCYISNVLILSRLGEEYYLEIPVSAIIKSSVSVENKNTFGTDANKMIISDSDIRVTILSSHVLSWSSVINIK
ncbi:hypothetical protein [Cobetia crustatorum]|uniref:Uncharacterized protein n=1 Tax=Cobetia crustatorum TaxID=553385 RepID=A0A558HM19_9GAMM|nr:hypothetical protein [Cobetia crustatorum]TVU70165.1 hypothetical protein FQP86_10235 [Cobetia crustatorum]